MYLVPRACHGQYCGVDVFVLDQSAKLDRKWRDESCQVLVSECLRFSVLRKLGNLDLDIPNNFQQKRSQ